MIVRRPTILTMKQGSESLDYLAITYLLKSQRIDYDEHVEPQTAMKLARGRLNPAGDGFIVILPGIQAVYNAVDLALWIERQGMKLAS